MQRLITLILMERRMMKKMTLLAALLGLSAPFAYGTEATMPAGGAGGVGSEIEEVAEDEVPVTANISFVSNYVYRGISQTGGKPAVQGGYDYEHSGSGLYVGVWGSSSSFFSDLYADRAGKEGAVNSSFEFDAFLGIKNHFAKDFKYDVGFLRYTFPGNYAPGATKGDTSEVYGAIGYKWITAKYSYSLGNTFGVDQAKGTNYVELNANYPVTETVVLGLHVGKQTFKGATADARTAAGASPTYSDYRLGVTKKIDEYELGLAYSKTNARTGAGTFYNVLGRDLGKGVAIVSLTRTF